jgi:hypothetical protein
MPLRRWLVLLLTCLLLVQGLSLNPASAQDDRSYTVLR